MEGATDIAEMAERVESLYVAYMRTRRGSRGYQAGTKHRCTFRSVAELCIQHKLDPATHVRALMLSVPDPYPNKLLGSRAVSRTQELFKREQRDERMQLDAQFARLRGRLNVGYHMTSELVSECEDFSPSFRFCVAIQAGLPAVAALYRDAARLELRVRPVLLDLLRPMLPHSFVEVLDHGFNSGANNASNHSPGPRPGHDSGREPHTAG